MELNLLNIATILAYVSFSTDLLLQIRRVLKTHSSNDISSRGVEIRALGASVVMLKLISLEDPVLIACQALFLTVLFTYLVVVLRHRRKHRKHKRKSSKKKR